MVKGRSQVGQTCFFLPLLDAAAEAGVVVYGGLAGVYVGEECEEPSDARDNEGEGRVVVRDALDEPE